METPQCIMCYSNPHLLRMSEETKADFQPQSTLLTCFGAWYTLDRSPPGSLEGIRLSVPGSLSTSLWHPYLQKIEMISCGLEG